MPLMWLSTNKALQAPPSAQRATRAVTPPTITSIFWPASSLPTRLELMSRKCIPKAPFTTCNAATSSSTGWPRLVSR